MDQSFIKVAEQHISTVDPIFGRLISTQVLAPQEDRGGYFASLCRSIIGQQVSVAAARAINQRFETTTNLSPLKVVNLKEEQIKEIGLSKQKTNYLKDLSAHFVDNPEIYNHLDKQPDQDVIDELVAVKGIGPWTAQMFLMFTLQRPDVFAPDDVGLQKGVVKLYGLESVPPKADLIKIAEKWKPYRTVASFHLWQSLN